MRMQSFSNEKKQSSSNTDALPHQFIEEKNGDLAPPLLIEQEWLNTEETASYLRLSIGSVRNLTSNGEIPYYKLGRRTRYRLEDLRNLLLSKKRAGVYGI